MPQLSANTETEIANAALSSIKAGKILSIDGDDTDKAKVVRKWFAIVRDGLQRRYKWNCTESRLTLPSGGTPPPFGFCLRFPWTADMLGVRDVHGCHRRSWKVEGRSIIANAAAPLKVVASVRVTDVASWDVLLKATMIAMLAYAIAPEAGKDDDTTDRAKEAAQAALAAATPVDAGEGSPDTPEEQDVILARY